MPTVLRIGRDLTALSGSMPVLSSIPDLPRAATTAQIDAAPDERRRLARGSASNASRDCTADPGELRCRGQRENARVADSSIDVEQLSAEERLLLIEQIWDSPEAEALPVTEAQKAELDRRIEAMDRDGARGIPGADVLTRIRGRTE